MHSMKKMKMMRIQYPDPVAQGKNMINGENFLFIILFLLIYLKSHLTITDKAKDKKADRIT